jgi:hypothetical protein
MKLFYLLSFMFVVFIHCGETAENLELKVTQVDNQATQKLYKLVEGATYNGECADLDYILNNDMTDYQVESVGKREGYADCLLSKGVIKLSGDLSPEDQNLMNQQIFNLYIADMFRLSLQTLQGRQQLRNLFQESPEVVGFYRDAVGKFIPNFDAVLAELVS